MVDTELLHVFSCLKLDYINCHLQISELEQARDAAMARNKEIAEHNMGLEPKLKEGKANLWELYEKARSLQDEVESKRAQLGNHCKRHANLLKLQLVCSKVLFFVAESLNSRTSLDTTHALLQASSAQAEEKSEELAESFLGGDIDLESFLSDFPHKRMSAHLLRLKTEKMAEIVNSSRNMGPSSFSGAAPYPVSPAMMPMPQYQM